MYYFIMLLSPTPATCHALLFRFSPSHPQSTSHLSLPPHALQDLRGWPCTTEPSQLCQCLMLDSHLSLPPCCAESGDLKSQSRAGQPGRAASTPHTSDTHPMLCRICQVGHAPPSPPRLHRPWGSLKRTHLQARLGAGPMTALSADKLRMGRQIGHGPAHRRHRCASRMHGGWAWGAARQEGQSFNI